MTDEEGLLIQAARLMRWVVANATDEVTMKGVAKGWLEDYREWKTKSKESAQKTNSSPTD